MVGLHRAPLCPREQAWQERGPGGAEGGGLAAGSASSSGVRVERAVRPGPSAVTLQDLSPCGRVSRGVRGGWAGGCGARRSGRLTPSCGGGRSHGRFIQEGDQV